MVVPTDYIGELTVQEKRKLEAFERVVLRSISIIRNNRVKNTVIREGQECTLREVKGAEYNLLNGLGM